MAPLLTGGRSLPLPPAMEKTLATNLHVAAVRLIRVRIPCPEVALFGPAISLAGVKVHVDMGGTFGVDAIDLMVAFCAPHGQIAFANVDRNPQIALQPVHGTEFSNLGAEVLEKRLSRGSIVREMACDVLMSPDTAETLANWLLEQAELARKTME